jgi:3-methyladenine DNA glycosylase AlkD
MEEQLEKFAQPEAAEQMLAYMKNQYEFYGIKRPVVREVTKPFFSILKSSSWSDKKQFVDWCWEKPQREWQYIALDLLSKNKKELLKKDIEWLEWLVRTQSWWDTVDMIASHMVGAWAQKYPEATEKMIQRWAHSNHLWLERCTIIYQIKYKDKTNQEILFRQCDLFKHSNEFFLRKAIGWALRAYADTNPKAVMKYVKSAGLKPLSEKEALRKVV